MTDSVFDRRLVEMAVTDSRAQDERQRTEQGLLIVDVAQLMREIARYMPNFQTDIEEKRYLEAVADIAIHVNAVTMHHDSVTGELRKGGPSVTIPPEETVAEGLKARDPATRPQGL